MKKKIYSTVFIVLSMKKCVWPGKPTLWGQNDIFLVLMRKTAYKSESEKSCFLNMLKCRKFSVMCRFRDRVSVRGYNIQFVQYKKSYSSHKI